MNEFQNVNVFLIVGAVIAISRKECHIQEVWNQELELISNLKPKTV